MKSLQESLFDNDLVEKDVEIDIEELKDILFYFGRTRAIFFDKNDLEYREGKQSIFIRKNFVEYNLQVELDLGVTNYYNNNHKLIPGFYVPSLTIRTFDYKVNPQWNASRSDYNATIRQMEKRLPELITGKYHTSVIPSTRKGMSAAFDLYDKMIKYFASKKFQDHILKYVGQFVKTKSPNRDPEIPGLIMDILMKEIIAKS